MRDGRNGRPGRVRDSNAGLVGLDTPIMAVWHVQDEAVDSGSLNYPFASSSNPGSNGLGPSALRNADTYRSRASASYVTGAHNAKIGFEGAYYSEKIRNQVNDMRLELPLPDAATTGTWNAATRSGNCLRRQHGHLRVRQHDPVLPGRRPTNRTYLRPRPVGFEMNTGVGGADERVWFGALYLAGSVDAGPVHAERRAPLRPRREPVRRDLHRPRCLRPVQPMAAILVLGPAKGVRYNDLTPRWGVAWDVFGTGKTSLKWNMGKYLQAASLTGLYVDNNAARRSTNALTRGWDDVNGNRIVECEFGNPTPHTSATGDFCAQPCSTRDGVPSQRVPDSSAAADRGAAATRDSICGRTESSSQLHQDYCAEAGQNLMSGWSKRRNEWQFGLGMQHELLPRLSVEVTYNRRKYGNLTDAETVSRGLRLLRAWRGRRGLPDLLPDALNYESELFDFYRFTAPVDPRLPNGGGYVDSGLARPEGPAALPAGGGGHAHPRTISATRGTASTPTSCCAARGGLRISGGTSTGRATRDMCYTDIDRPNVKGRDGNNYAADAARSRPSRRTCARTRATRFRGWTCWSAPSSSTGRGGSGPPTSSSSESAVVWETGSAHRPGTQFNTRGGNAGTTSRQPAGHRRSLRRGPAMWD